MQAELAGVTDNPRKGFGSTRKTMAWRSLLCVALLVYPRKIGSHSRGRGRICGLSGNGRTVSRNSQKHILRVEPCRNKYMKACQILLVEIETARRNAELNVLEETNEDDGF